MSSSYSSSDKPLSNNQINESDLESESESKLQILNSQQNEQDIESSQQQQQLSPLPKNLELTTVIPPPAHLNIAPRNPQNHPVAVLRRVRAQHGRPAFIAGPMVRYSKLPFREVVRLHDTDIVYTPMILAREFVRHPFARDTDFTTNEKDAPLVAQFGANNVQDLLRAVSLIRPYVDGIGLNCGCPIKDQVREGIGAALMTKPELVAQMVNAVKREAGPGFCVEVKMRVHRDLSETVRFAQSAEAAGADYLSVHGRRKAQRSSEPVDLDAIKLVKNSVKIPVVANGDAFSMEDALRIAEYTGCDGVMAARGILANPGMFDIASYKRRQAWLKKYKPEQIPCENKNNDHNNNDTPDTNNTSNNNDNKKESIKPRKQQLRRRRLSFSGYDEEGSSTVAVAGSLDDVPLLEVDGEPVTESDLFGYTSWQCIEQFWDLVTSYGLPYRVAQHHFSEMVDMGISKRMKKSMNDARNLAELLTWFDERFDLRRPMDEGFAQHREYPWKREFVLKERKEAREQIRLLEEQLKLEQQQKQKDQDQDQKQEQQQEQQQELGQKMKQLSVN